MSEINDHLSLTAWAISTDMYLMTCLNDYLTDQKLKDAWLSYRQKPENKFEYAAIMTGLILAGTDPKCGGQPTLSVPEYHLRSPGCTEPGRSSLKEDAVSAVTKCARFMVHCRGAVDVFITVKNDTYVCTFGDTPKKAYHFKGGDEKNRVVLLPRTDDKYYKDPWDTYVAAMSCWSSADEEIECSAQLHLDLLSKSMSEMRAAGGCCTWCVDQNRGYYLEKHEDDWKTDASQRYGSFVTDISYVTKEAIPEYMIGLRRLAENTGGIWEQIRSNVMDGLGWISLAFSVVTAFKKVNLSKVGILLSAMPFALDWIAKKLSDPSSLWDNYKAIEAALKKDGCITYKDADKREILKCSTGLIITRINSKHRKKNDFELKSGVTYSYMAWDHNQDNVSCLGAYGSVGNWVMGKVNEIPGE